MKFIQGQNRQQINLFPLSIEESIDQDNEVRVIDLFVNSLSLKDFGFEMDYIENGRPAYHPADLLKLYIYGYMNRIRSSRSLEKECKRNIELMWLLKGLQPDHNTISNFRRDNPKPIKKVFRASVQIAKHFDLIGGTLLVGDSTKLRAQNSKKNNFSQSKIDRHIEYIDTKLEEYNKTLEEQDNENKQLIQAEIEKHLKRRDFYKKLEQQLQETGVDQISTSDTESQLMVTQGFATEVVYCVQTTVDAKFKIPIDYKVTSKTDIKAMGNMVRRAKSILHTNNFTALYDKGYHNGNELKTVQNLGVNVIVAYPEASKNAPDMRYNVINFKYNKKEDTYTCPEGQLLVTNGKWLNTCRKKGRSIIRVKHYKSSACKTCPNGALCSKNKDRRLIERSEFADYIEKNRMNVKLNGKLYKQMKAIVEHPYGTIKRQWGFNYILTKQGRERASADVGLMFIAYNLRRIINILGKDILKQYLKMLLSFNLTRNFLFKRILSCFAEWLFSDKTFYLSFPIRQIALKSSNKLIFKLNMTIDIGF